MKVESGQPGLTNYRIKVPGTTATVCLGNWEDEPDRWFYSVWSEASDLLASGEVDLAGLSESGLDRLNERVARAVFVLHCE